VANLARRLEPSQAGPEAAVGQHENLGCVAFAPGLA
jgi:hypothetical protein